MKKILSATTAIALALAMASPGFAAGKKSGFVSNAGASDNPAPNTENEGTTTGPKGALKNDKSTPNTDLPGKSR
ncbi:MAG TPA: hypothetical protein VN240_00755 [Propylenella sp.]|nr:hypothetical protein [Propylenella sp.]